MSATTESPSAAPASGVVGTAVLRRIRRLIVWALCAGLIYTILTTASTSRCVGGVTGDGGFIDSAGNPTDSTPTCISLTLKPSFVVYVALAAIVLIALSRVIRRAGSDAAAIRTFDRAALAIGITVVACMVISYAWFALLPIDSWDGVNTNFWFPFPFGSVTLQVSPMQG